MNGAVTVAKMEPRGSSVSPLHTRKRSRILGLRKSTPGSRSGRSNGWAECREKKIGIEPKGSTFLLTFPLIGQCYIKDFPNRVFSDLASVTGQLERGSPQLAADHERLRSITAWPWIVSLNLNAS